MQVSTGMLFIESVDGSKICGLLYSRQNDKVHKA